MDPTINRAAPRYIPVAKPSLTAAEANAARAAVAAGWVSGGPHVARFERELALAHGQGHGVACNSGTTALHLALAALDVGPGDEVVVPTLTMVAVANAVLYRGATPVFVDSEVSTGNPDPAWAKRHGIVNRRTKAAIVPHLYGVPAEAFLETVQRVAPRVAVIEDCAESHYASFTDGRPVGSRGRLACWSFYGNKIVTTGEGGLLATNDEQVAQRLRSLRAHAFTPGHHFHHQELAYGYRMTEMAAAVGLAQHARRHELIARRAAIAQRYFDRLEIADFGSRIADWSQGHRKQGADTPRSPLLPRNPKFRFQARTFGSAWWVFPIIADDEGRRDVIRRALAEAGVETRSYFVPLHRQPHLRRYATREYPVADDLAGRGLYLPLWPGMSDDDVDYVCGHLGKALGVRR
ncbi:MAG TPA: DegT/DnrJ/EryC1/StrS family aminotransferase [Pirellulales bacterium]|nr:DegT/DnrJ/EryC1/StrS family aminotransferase [Pirellulales bacterium]